MSRYEKSLRFIMSFRPDTRYGPEIADNDILKTSLRFHNVLASRDIPKSAARLPKLYVITDHQSFLTSPNYT